MSKLKLLFVTGSRGEWGYIRPVLRLCQKEKAVEYRLCVTNMHLLPSFGQSVKEIEADGFKVHYPIFMSLDGYNHFSMVKSLGIFLNSFVDVLCAERPDWIVLAGDRGEQLVGALAGGFTYIPVAHIQAGELSGNVDGMTRHAIGKFAHLHFASNPDAAERLARLGEEPFRIHNVGAPQLDELVQGLYSDRDELKRKFETDFRKGYLLFVQHPVTEEYDQAAKQIGVAMSALRKIDLPKVVILPNNDAGSSYIRDGIEKGRRGEFYTFSNLKREDYLGLLKNAACIVGNSSSGLLEAPTFNVPAVNLGRRQARRLQGINVINAPFQEKKIVSAIKQALQPAFRRQMERECVNPYGDGRSSQRILKILRQTPIDDRLLIKTLTY
jgi:GDP/UDP-N,N'-diacetylbacillosamine 2-epimerase (hydrolysing)